MGAVNIGVDTRFLQVVQVEVAEVIVGHWGCGPIDAELVAIKAFDANGQGTYAGGRFLAIEPAAADGTVILDFNRAYNPLCNYSPAFNCPIPPRENRLQVAIRAGELTYPH